MESIDLTGVGTFLLGVAAVVSSVAAWRSGKKIAAIDHAVNGKPVGAQSIQSQVSDLHSDRPPPPQIPVEVNGEALLPLVRRLVAYIEEDRNG